MKRFILSLALSLLVITVSAQIQRTFLGCTLAETSFRDVERVMTLKGYEMNSNSDCIVAHDVKFAGYKCKSIHFNFYKNVLYQVAIIFESSYNESTLLETLGILADKLDDKYSSFKTYEVDDAKVYEDDKTRLVLSIAGDNKKFLFMSYRDNSLYGQKESEEDAEL